MRPSSRNSRYQCSALALPTGIDILILDPP